MQHTELMDLKAKMWSVKRNRKSPAWLPWLMRACAIVALVAVGLVGLLLSAAPTSAAAGADFLGPNEWLYAEQSITSADGRFTLYMQSDGNLVLYQNDVAPLWATNTVGSGADRVVMQSDGNLVLYTPSLVPVWASNTLGEPSTLLMQNDGNLVIYRQSGGAVWATNTSALPNPWPTGCVPGSREAALFVSVYFQGRCHNFRTGSYPDIRTMNLPDNAISSVRLGSNAVVELCSDANFEGVCEVISGDVFDLANHRIGNDRVTSLRVWGWQWLFLPYIVE